MIKVLNNGPEIKRGTVERETKKQRVRETKRKADIQRHTNRENMSEKNNNKSVSRNIYEK